ncbi:MAG: hypothetical protein U0793_16650 [Gemmataceae bacterium]
MFTYGDLRNLLDARPFQPFRLFLSDGGHVDILSPEVVLAGKRFAVVGILDADTRDKAIDRYTTVWYLHVTRHEMLRPGQPPLMPPGPMGEPAPTSV